MRRAARALALVAAVGAVVLVLLTWRDARVDHLLDGAAAGDVLQVESDECSRLQERGLIDPDIECGYWDRLEVRLRRDPQSR